MLTTDEIRRRALSFERWHYQFDLRGVLTPIRDPESVNRHLQRRRYFFDALVEICGGSLHGRRILDLGCNAGFWSLAAIQAGCEFICGIDGRAMHIEQAELVFDANQVERSRYRFLQADLFRVDMTELGKFDVVLCLGLLYHVNRPIELMERIAHTDAEILVIDTSVHPGEDPVFRIMHEDVADPRNALESGLVLLPTVSAVIEMVRAYGFLGAVLRPCFDDYTGAEDFRDGYRRAFLCARRTDLTGLADRSEVLFKS